MSLQGLATVAAAAQIKESEIEKPSFPLRTSSMPLFKRDSNDLLGLSPSNINNNNNNNNNSNNNTSSSSSGPSPVSGSVQNLIQPKTDWRLFLTIEERQLIRRKISAAYEAKLKSYEELLQTCAAIDEELVYISAPSRLDYFKAGLQFEKRVSEKRKQLVDSLIPQLQITTNNNNNNGNNNGNNHNVSPSFDQSDANDDDSCSSSGRSTPDDSEHISKKVKFDSELADTLQTSS